MTSLLQLILGKIFSDLPHIAVYVDDITVFSVDLEIHSDHVAETIRRLNLWKLPIRLEKSRFGLERFRLLGFIVSEKGVEKDPEKVA